MAPAPEYIFVEYKMCVKNRLNFYLGTCDYGVIESIELPLLPNNLCMYTKFRSKIY